ncbi:putative mitochondrial amino acid transporter ARG-13 [Ramaria rubella]|nr:putative mitochondrial amino acid transporter ARG-13 [Ramaria rubella]
MDVAYSESEQTTFESSSPTWRGLRDVAFGSTAGMVSKVFEHPFDLCKVRLQSQVMDHTARFSGPIDCLTQTWQKEGLRGLYRGLPAPIVGAMAENASLFLTYNELQTVIRRWKNVPESTQLPLNQLMMAAAGAGGVASFLLTPIELVKCKMQVQMLAAETPSLAVPTASVMIPTRPSFRNLQGPFSIVGSTIRQHGLRGLWLGHTGTFIRETGGGAAWFGSNEAVSSILLDRLARKTGRPRSELSKKDLKWYQLAFAGACAGVAFNLALFPADSVKSAVQTEEELRPGTRTSIGTMAKKMWKKEGIKGFYAGCGVTVARAAPSNAMIFLIYDGLNSRFG